MQLPNGSQQRVNYKIYKGAIRQKNSPNLNYSKPPKPLSFKILRKKVITRKPKLIKDYKAAKTSRDYS